MVARDLSGTGNDVCNHGAKQHACEESTLKENLPVAQLRAWGKLEDERVVDACTLPCENVQPIHVHVQIQ